jgi:hypothetical protein
MNDIVVELFDRIITNINGELTNSLSKELFETIKNIGKDINNIKDSAEKLNKDTINRL